MQQIYDVVIVGAGASGLMAAAVATSHGASVLILEMGEKPARKVMASGGGRCNITNMAAAYNRYFGNNPNFVRGALCRVTPSDIIQWAHKHNLNLVEKDAGQYFCADGAAAVVDALLQDIKGTDIEYNTCVSSITKKDGTFHITTDTKTFYSQSVVVATGGTSFGALGVSDIGYKIAKSFGHKIVPVRPGLCAIAVSGFSSELAGISLPAEIIIGKNKICDSLLFTHFGIGGPAAYRASLYDIKDGFVINLTPGIDIFNIMRDAKRTNGRKEVSSILAQYMPMRVAKWIMGDDNRRIADIKDSELKNIAERISRWYINANQIKYHGMSSAEVVRGGVDTNDISSKTMESKLCSGLFFAGEVLDIAGDLGGFNLQWAWASGRVAGENAAKTQRIDT